MILGKTEPLTGPTREPSKPFGFNWKLRQDGISPNRCKHTAVLLLPLTRSQVALDQAMDVAKPVHARDTTMQPTY